MSDSSIPIKGTGRKIDTTEVTTDAGVVDRQVCVIGDASSADALAGVDSTLLRVGSADLAIARGLQTGVTVPRKFGRNPSVGNTEVAVVNGLTTAAPYMPSAAVTVRVRSSSANDTAAGTGAQSLVVVGLDSTFAEISQTVTMNGATNVTLPTQMVRVYRTYVPDGGCGTYGGTNIGTITVESSAGTKFFDIAIGSGQTQVCHYTVPAGYTLYLKDVHMAVEANTTCDIKMKQRQRADDVVAPYSPVRVVMEWDGVVGQIDYDYQGHFMFPEKSDVWFTATKNSAGTSKVSTEFTYWMVANG